MYEIIQKFINYNRSYQPLKAIGGVQHETANPGDTDEAEVSYFNAGNRRASAHAFIDWDSITQCIPWNEQAWHAGPTANRSYWGVEMCHTDDPVKFNEIWKRAVWFWAYLFTEVANPKITKVTPDNLMSHAQVSETWRETDHTDPVSYFASFGLTMTDFRDAVQKCINTGIIDDVATGGAIMLIRRGDKGQAVKDLQSKLNQIGYSLITDGDFGPATEAAVRSFQSGNGLASDGICGPLTMAAIDSMVVKVRPEPTEPDYKHLYEAEKQKNRELVNEIQALYDKCMKG